MSGAGSGEEGLSFEECCEKIEEGLSLEVDLARGFRCSVR